MSGLRNKCDKSIKGIGYEQCADELYTKRKPKILKGLGEIIDINGQQIKYKFAHTYGEQEFTVVVRDDVDISMLEVGKKYEMEFEIEL